MRARNAGQMKAVAGFAAETVLSSARLLHDTVLQAANYVTLGHLARNNERTQFALQRNAERGESTYRLAESVSTSALRLMTFNVTAGEAWRDANKAWNAIAGPFRAANAMERAGDIEGASYVRTRHGLELAAAVLPSGRRLAGEGVPTVRGLGNTAWTKESIFNTYPEKTTLQLSGATEQVQFLSANVPGLSQAQAQMILDKAYGRGSSAVFGGGRIRGDFTSGGFGVGSDIDVGFGDLNANQAGKLIDGLNKQFSQDSKMLMLERTRITPGNSTPTITNPIISPEEFFQRSGMRVAPDPKAGQLYTPSGSVTVRSDGTVIIIPPGALQ